MDDSRIRSKTAPFLFENGLVWTGPKSSMIIARGRFEIPARVKTDPMLNNYLTQTIENNARSGVRRVQAEMSFIFIFPIVVQIEKTCVVFQTLINVQTT